MESHLNFSIPIYSSAFRGLVQLGGKRMRWNPKIEYCDSLSSFYLLGRKNSHIAIAVDHCVSYSFLSCLPGHH